MRGERGGAAVWVVAYAIIYIGSAYAVSSSVSPSGFTPWYPPAGLTLAFLIVAAPRPGPVAVAVVVRLINTAVVFPDAMRDEPVGELLLTLAVTGFYALAAWTLRRVKLEHARVRELGWFVVVGVVAAPLGSALSAAVVEIVFFGDSGHAAVDGAFTFWVGDAVAVATIVPAVLLAAAAVRGVVTPPRLPTSRAARVETTVQAAALILVPLLAIAISHRHGQTAFLVLAMIPVVWVALRRSLVFVAVGLLVLTTALSVLAAWWYKPDLALAELQAVLLANALAGLYIAAVTHSQEMAMADLIESEERYRSVVGSTPDLVARFNSDGALRYASDPPWLRDVGAVELVVDDLRARWDIATAGLGEDGIVSSVEWEHTAGGDTRTYSARLSPERRADGRVGGVIAVVTDLTPQRRAEAQREDARRHDPLTGLMNRTAILDVLGALDRATIAARLAMLLLDLDQFNSINSAFGHEDGDAILRCVGTRVLAAVPDALAAARIGSDEFAVAFLVDDGVTGASEAADRLLRSVRDCIPVGEHEHFLTASIGVAVGGAPGASPEDVFADAEEAMHAAKEAGRDRVALFGAVHRSLAADRRAMETLLRNRLAERSIVVHYQPAFDLRSDAVHAVEALVRLRGDDGEIVMPDRFIKVAEDAGLDVELGTLVLEEVLWQLASWPSDSLVVHVNMTARQLTGDGFASQVLDACDRTGVAPARLCLELTETLVMSDPEAAITALRELRAAGVRASLDDFGTGYSSMSYLSRLPVSGLKIDRAFVEGLPDDPLARAVVGLVSGLGDALHLDVIAEGIETADQVACLLDLGCHRGQGFLLARPSAAEDIVPLLAAHAMADADIDLVATPPAPPVPRRRSTSSRPAARQKS